MSSLYLSPTKAIAALALGLALAASAWWLADRAWLASLILGAPLAWAVVVDIDRFILPDILTLGLVLAGLAFAAAAGPDFLLNACIGAAMGYLLLVAVEIYYRRVRGREGLGRGDAKLLAAAGAWLGWAGLPLVLLIGSVAGLVWAGGAALIARRLDLGRAVPFGPFIALGLWVVWLAPDLAGQLAIGAGG